MAVGLVGGVLLFSAMALSRASFRPEDAALGHNTVTHLSAFEGQPVASWVDQPEPITHAIERARAEGRPVALWMGASQLHAINQLKPGDEIAVYHANASARLRSSRLLYVQVSEPNANLNELLAAYLHFRQGGHLPDLLILALTYDDLREPGVREVVLRILPDLSSLELHLDHAGGIDNLSRARVELELAGRESLDTRGELEGTPQQRLEEVLTRGLEGTWSPYAYRGRLVASFELASLELANVLRSHVTRIRVPPVPTSQKRWNLEALETLMELTRQDGVRLLVYKAPHRPDEPVFYHDRGAYDAFFLEWSKRFEQSGIAYLDLERLVPARFWGVTNDGTPDVFHFSATGHELLGSRIDAAAVEMGL